MNKKQSMILLLIFIACFLVLSISTGLALFTLDVSYETKREKTTATIMPTFIFDNGGPINIHATGENFAIAKPSLSSETKCTATLKAGSDIENSFAYYDFKIKIEENDFVYTREDHNAELLLIITDEDGNVVKNIPGLNYVKANEYEGFDITEVTGEYTISTENFIKTTSTTTDEWNVKVIFINYDSPQDENQNKTLKGYVVMGQTGEI